MKTFINAKMTNLNQKQNIAILILAHLCIWSCGRELPRFKVKFERNKEAFESTAESFFRNGKIRDIGRTNTRTYNLGGDIIVLTNQKFDEFTKNIEEVDIEKNESYQNFDHFLKSRGMTRMEFFKWADFLKKYDLFSLSTDTRLVFIGFRGGFLGSESGLFYVPIGNEDAVSDLYPKWPVSMDYVEKIDERWYYYVE